MALRLFKSVELENNAQLRQSNKTVVSTPTATALTIGFIRPLSIVVQGRKNILSPF
jgi:hypothetical protein